MSKIKILALATAVAITGGMAFAPLAAIGQQMTIAQLMEQITALQAQLAALQGGDGDTESASMSECDFTRNLRVGSRGDDVECLQQGLIDAGHLDIDAPTGYFGNLTKKAVVAWQKDVGLPAFGFFWT